MVIFLSSFFTCVLINLGGQWWGLGFVLYFLGNLVLQKYFCWAPANDIDTMIRSWNGNLSQLIAIKFKFPTLKKKCQVQDLYRGPPIPTTDALDHSTVMVPPRVEKTLLLIDITHPS